MRIAIPIGTTRSRDKRLDTQDLCAALMNAYGAGGDIDFRISRIADIARIHLGALSLTVWEYDRSTAQVSLCAMPGVKATEYMRGPTNSFIDLQWRSKTTGTNLPDWWVEHRHDLKAIRDHVRSESPSSVWLVDDFPERELKASGRAGKRWAVAKIHLWRRREAGRPDDPVGLVFVNFAPADRNRYFFTSELRAVIEDVCRLIRELLITKNYRSAAQPDNWEPSQLLHDIDALFKSFPPKGTQAIERGDDLSNMVALERHVARTAIDAATKLTANYDGYTDLVQVVNEHVGRVLSLKDATVVEHALHVSEGSHLNRCIREGRHFISNDLSDASQPALISSPTDNMKIWRSAAFVPVMLGESVVAVIRLLNERRLCFTDERARALVTLSQMARFGFLRLDEFNHRSAATQNLGFFNDQLASAVRLKGSEDLALRSSMLSLLRALRAERVMYWPVIAQTDENSCEFGHGYVTSDEGDSCHEVAPDDPDVGPRPDSGFTKQIAQWSVALQPNVIVAVHAYADGPHSYVFEAYCPKHRWEQSPPDGTVWADAHEHMSYQSVYDANQAGEVCSPVLTQRVGLPQRFGRARTHIAFVLRELEEVRGVVWVSLDRLKPVSWWECAFLDSVARSMVEGTRMDNMKRALHAFRHSLENSLGELLADPNQLGEDGKVTEFLRGVQSRVSEARAMADAASGSPGAAIRITEGSQIRRVSQWLDTVLKVETGFTASELVASGEWDISIDRGADIRVGGAFFSPIWHLVENAWKHGGGGLSLHPGVTRAFCIWSTMRGSGALVTYVGNKTAPSDSGSNQRFGGHGLGLARAVAKMCGGYVRPVKAHSLPPEAPPMLRECDFIMELMARSSTDDLIRALTQSIKKENADVCSVHLV